MRKYLRWCSLPAIAAIGLVLASCGDENGPTAIQEANTPTVTETETAAETPFQAYPPTAGCMANDADANAANVSGWNPGPTEYFNCTANDIRIANARAASGGPLTCVEGQPFTADIVADVVETATSERVDVGIWIESGDNPGDDPKLEAQRGSCDFFFFDQDDIDGPQDYPIDYDGDECGDMNDAGTVTDFELDAIDLICPSDPIVIDGQTYVEVSSCVSWTQPGGDRVCYDGVGGDPSDPRGGTLPANKSKCNCDPFLIPVEIHREAKIKVVKDLNPASDPGRFNLNIWNADDTSAPDAIVESEANAGDGDMTDYYTFQWVAGDPDWKHTAFVQETAGTPNPGLAFYNSSWECKDNAGAGSVVASGSGAGPSGAIVLDNADDVVCTFTNNRIPVPTITVTKDATPTFTRTWTWDITKQAFRAGDATEVPTGYLFDPVAVGEVIDLDYTVGVTSGYQDSGWAVSGMITVTVAGSLPPYSGTITVADTLTGDIEATVDCDPVTAGNQNTKAVSAAGSFTCSYSANLPDGTSRTNTAKAKTTWNSGDPGSGQGTANVAFTTPTTETDESVTVYDNKGGLTDIQLGTVTRDDDDFDYNNPLPACVPPGNQRLNTAYLETNDTATRDSAQHAVSTACPEPPPGCTLTQGYWKTHSEFGPAPYDDNWGNVIGTGASSCGSAGPPSINSDGDGAGTGASVAFDTFFGSAVTNVCYFDVFWTPPKGGNPYLILAHQYIAAQLNKLNGADASVVQAYLDEAAALLAAYDGQMSINKKSPDGVRAIELAGYLGSYNEGTYPGGPPHCDDDGYPN